MSAQGQVSAFLQTLKPETTGVVPITPNQIALQTGINRDLVNKTLYNLMVQKRLEIIRGSNGREVIGFKPLDWEPRQRGGRRKKGERVTVSQRTNGQNGHAEVADAPRRSKGPTTPNIDEYGRLKARYEAIRSEFGDRIDASFREDAYAEEGLRLKERLANVEDQLFEARRERDEYERDLSGMRARKQAALTEDALRNGSVVQHSQD